MPMWTGLVIGWIIICTTAEVPNARWGNPPLTMFPTQAACIAAERATEATLAQLWKTVGRTDALELTCWCQQVTPARGLTLGDFARVWTAPTGPTGPTGPIKVGP
jgi:hypothetical protein